MGEAFRPRVVKHICTIKIIRINPESGRVSGWNIWIWKRFRIDCLPQLPSTNSRSEKNFGRVYRKMPSVHLPQLKAPNHSTSTNSKCSKYSSPSSHFRTFSCVTQVETFTFWFGLPYKSHTILQPKYREQESSWNYANRKGTTEHLCR